MNQNQLYKYTIQILKQLNIPFTDPCDDSYEGDCGDCGGSNLLPKFIDGDNPLDAVYMNGNVGIGVTVPASTLHVIGTTTLNGNIGLVGDWFSQGDFIALGTAQFSFRDAVYSPVLQIDTINKRVGIGTATPNESLSVIGNLALTDRSAVPITLSGFSGGNILGDVTLGDSFSIDSGTLNYKTSIIDVNTSTLAVVQPNTVYHVINAGSTLTIDSASIVEGNTFEVKDSIGNASVNNIIIQTQGVETIDGDVNGVTINSDYGYVSLYVFGGNLYIKN